MDTKNKILCVGLAWGISVYSLWSTKDINYVTPELHTSESLPVISVLETVNETTIADSQIHSLH